MSERKIMHCVKLELTFGAIGIGRFLYDTRAYHAESMNSILERRARRSGGIEEGLREK